MEDLNGAGMAILICVASIRQDTREEPPQTAYGRPGRPVNLETGLVRLNADLPTPYGGPKDTEDGGDGIDFDVSPTPGALLLIPSGPFPRLPLSE